jgi:hypothetical protein
MRAVNREAARAGSMALTVSCGSGKIAGAILRERGAAGCFGKKEKEALYEFQGCT